ncbi:hypothetical protein [Methanofollis ethanolicus]|uniref:hypothetical protein n=1 Tax=Methanofollis ethanolicus TaxID=488124 RepID=UPI0008350ED1|nr:hypothetical protein [Methanofollis ethanolicus]
MTAQANTAGACLLLLLALLCIPAGVAGLQVGVEEAPPDTVAEEEVVDFTITLSGIPPAADTVIVDTDLVQQGDTPLLSPSGGGGNATNTTPASLPVPAGGSGLSIRIHGQAPTVTTVTQCGAVTLTTYDPKRSGYAYYRVRFTDDKGRPLTESDTRLFSIAVDAVDEFRAKLNQISDPFMRTYLQDLFEKGLVNEANALADYEMSRGAGVPLIWTVGGIVLTAVLALIAGIWIGGRESGGNEE